MENTKVMEFMDPPGVYGDTGTNGSHHRPPALNDAHVHLRAAQSCMACRKQKRKCNKVLPSCSLCSRMSRSCDYSDMTPTPSAGDFAMLRQKVTDLESKLEARNGQFVRASPFGHSRGEANPDSTPEQTSRFPTLFFLDAEMYLEAKMSIPKPATTVPSDVLSALGSITDIQDLAERYFENVHLWLPIVSKKRMQLLLSNPHLDMTADLSLLMLAMRLIVQNSHGSPQAAQTSLYQLVKRHLALVESNGSMTLQLLQSSILLAVYEMGHAIYPAAYLSTGHCVRIGQLLGLHDGQNALQVLARSGAWAEHEERRRCWWGCMLIDRYVNLGGQGRPLAASDPSPQVVLPADDDAWDLGEMTSSEPLYVSSPTTVRAGAFARTSQAAHLCGRLVQNLNDRLTDAPLRFSEAIQLHRTLTAFAALLLPEVQQSPVRYATPMALCYSALLHLYDPYGCTMSNRGEHTVEETEMQSIAIAGMKRAAGEILQFSHLLKMTMTNNMAAVSPLTADAIYSAATTYAWFAHESGSADMVESYHTLRETLMQMNSRWAVAGEYLKALDLTRDILYRDTTTL